jgi:hypothetical protein
MGDGRWGKAEDGPRDYVTTGRESQAGLAPLREGRANTAQTCHPAVRRCGGAAVRRWDGGMTE